MNGSLNLNVNGVPCKFELDQNRSLLDVLRTELRLTGSHFGCGSGLCGACTVLVNQRPALACNTPMWSLAEKSVTTIEGIAEHELGQKIQDELIRCNAAQCGYCTSGMVMACVGLLAAGAVVSDAQIKSALDGNLCRCGVHLRIVRAVKNVSAALSLN